MVWNIFCSKILLQVSTLICILTCGIYFPYPVPPLLSQHEVSRSHAQHIGNKYLTTCPMPGTGWGAHTLLRHSPNVPVTSLSPSWTALRFLVAGTMPGFPGLSRCLPQSFAHIRPSGKMHGINEQISGQLSFKFLSCKPVFKISVATYL